MDDEFDLNEEEEEEIRRQQEGQLVTNKNNDEFDEFDVDDEQITYFDKNEKKSIEEEQTLNPLEALKAQYNTQKQNEEKTETTPLVQENKTPMNQQLELKELEEEEEILTPSNISTKVLIKDEEQLLTNKKQDIWDLANQETIAREQTTTGVGVGKKPEIQKIIRLEELYTYLNGAAETREAMTKVETVQHSGFHPVLRLFQFISCYSIGTPLLSNQTLEDQKAYVFAFCKIKLDWENVKHVRLLFSIYRRLMDETSNPPMKGSHWEYIGFQRPNPETDLRDGGIFGLMQLLYFLEKDKRLVNRIFKMALEKVSEFPFAIVGLNMTQIVLHCIRKGKLQTIANKFNSFFEAVNVAYCAVFYDFYETWKGGKEIHQYGYVKKELQAKALSKMDKMIKEYQLNLASYNKQMKDIENKEKINF